MNWVENEANVLRRCLLLLVLACALLVGANPSTAAAARYDQTCGTLPGMGGYGYVKVANMTCRHGKKVTNKARKKFCKRHDGCAVDWNAEVQQLYKGTVFRNGWRCKVAVGLEYYRTKCRKGKRRVLASGGA